MGIPNRTFIRSFQKTFITENPIVIVLIQIKKILTNYKEFPQKNRCLLNDLEKRKTNLEKAKQVVASSSRKEKNTINIVN